MVEGSTKNILYSCLCLTRWRHEFSTFQRWYNRLSTIEDTLVRSSVVIGGQIFPGSQNIPVEDDHIPFLRRGVDFVLFTIMWSLLKFEAQIFELASLLFISAWCLLPRWPYVTVLIWSFCSKSVFSSLRFLFVLGVIFGSMSTRLKLNRQQSTRLQSTRLLPD